MKEKTVQEILFNPQNMGLALFYGVLYGLIYSYLIIPNCRHFVLWYTVGVNILLFVILFCQFDCVMNNWALMRNYLSTINYSVHFAYNNTVFPLFKTDDWIAFVISIVLVIGLGFAFYLLFNANMDSAVKLFDNNLSVQDRQSIENMRTFSGILLSLTTAFFLLAYNMTLSIFSEVKNRRNFQNLNDKMDTIIEKLSCPAKK